MTPQDHFKAAYDEIYKRSHEQARHYLDEFIRLKSSPDILATRVFPNSKEITESMGAFAAIRKAWGYGEPGLFSDESIAMVAVGDGSTPRTATLFAFLTRWQCYSVDPALSRWTPQGPSVKRLSVHAIPIEKFVLPECERVFLVGVHSHAALDVATAVVRAPRRRVDVVALPCCVKQELGYIQPTLEWEDYRIGSPKRTISVWSDL